MRVALPTILLVLLAIVADGQAARRRPPKPKVAPASVGSYNAGSLVAPATVPDEGPHHYLLYRDACYARLPLKAAYPRADRTCNRYAHPEVVEAVLAVAEEVSRAHPEAPRLPVGELSNRVGGEIPFHRSHQNGLDVDVYFLLRGPDAPPEGPPAADGTTPADPREIRRCTDGWHVERRDPKTGRWRLHRAFDPEWNWTMVALFAARKDVKVVFIGALLRDALARWAESSGVPAKVRARTLAKLKTPFCRPRHGRGAYGYRANGCPHDDHIHVRFLCPADSPACLKK